MPGEDAASWSSRLSLCQEGSHSRASALLRLMGSGHLEEGSEK